MFVTLCEAFQDAVRRADGVALRTPDDATTITWADYATRVERLAAGLAELGVGGGDTVGLLLANRPEFHLVDAAVMHLGATPFSIYQTSAPGQIAVICANAGNRVMVTEKRLVEQVRAAELPNLRWLVIVDAEVEGALTLDDVEARGDPGFDFEAAWRSVTPEHVATLIYTSGTTGPPKGVELTHANLIFTLRSMDERLPLPDHGRLISYLPHAHIVDRVLSHYLQMAARSQVTCLADPKQLFAASAEVHPTLWMGVPRIWEKLEAALRAQGIEPGRADDGLHERLGFDQVELFLTGAAPMPRATHEFFAALGVPICEAWGMSETSGIGLINDPGAIRIGTVGRPMPGVEVVLAEDGEILTRGPQLMRGYRNDPERTAEAIDADGWMHTGDVGRIDADGYVRLVDRKKDLIVSSGGKNMSPSNIEAALKSASPLIGQACCIGDGRPYNVALLVLDPDGVAAFGDGDVEGEVAAAVGRANTGLSRAEQIKRYTLLAAEWPPDGDELTPTMKLKRGAIAAKYAAEIEELYAEATTASAVARSTSSPS